MVALCNIWPSFVHNMCKISKILFKKILNALGQLETLIFKKMYGTWEKGCFTSKQYKIHSKMAENRQMFFSNDRYGRMMHHMGIIRHQHVRSIQNTSPKKILNDLRQLETLIFKKMYGTWEKGCFTSKYTPKWPKTDKLFFRWPIWSHQARYDHHLFLT